MAEYLELDTLDKKRLCDIIYEDDGVFVGKRMEQNIDDSWRHGNRYDEIWEILERNDSSDVSDKSTERYFRIQYEETGNGEYNSLHELTYHADEVSVTKREVIKIVLDTKTIREL